MVRFMRYYDEVKKEDGDVVYSYGIRKSNHSARYYYLTMICKMGRKWKTETTLSKPMTKNELLKLANTIHENLGRE